VDNVFPHHEDEIAQSEGTFGARHVNYWVHGQHLLADGAKMAKSSGNVFLLDDLSSRGFNCLSFRYLCMTVRYRHRMNFTFTSLKASEKALTNLRQRIWQWRNSPSLSELPAETEEWRRRFWAEVDNDMDLPGALAVTWEMARSELPDQAKLDLILDFDRVFGLDLDQVPNQYELPQPVRSTLDRRANSRREMDYAASDDLRSQLASTGYLVQDRPGLTLIRPKTDIEQRQEVWEAISASREVGSLLDSPPQYDFTFVLNAYNYVEDVRRCVASMLEYSQGYSAEIIVVDNGSSDGTAEWLEEFKRAHDNVRVVHCDHVIGDAAGKNIGLKQSLGRNIIVLDASAEIVGDILGPIAERLADESVGIFGPYGLTTDDMQHFHEEVEHGDADAMQAYCMAFRRSAMIDVGLMRENFRFYRNLDIDYSFQFKDKGYRIFTDISLPMVRHEHRQWTELDDNQRDELSRKNFGRFLKRWGNRPDLLITSGARGFETGFRH
jgi:cysteinyl-tRNA synthetase